MSWRIFFENVLYFGYSFPSFVGEYHIYHDTEGTFAKCNHDDGKVINAAQLYIFKLLDEMVEPGSEINAGFVHTYSPGELTLFGLDSMNIRRIEAGILNAGTDFDVNIIHFCSRLLFYFCFRSGFGDPIF